MKLKKKIKQTYSDLIDQTFDFPQEGLYYKDDSLHYNDVPLMPIIEKYGAPLKLTYLPRISQQIQKCKGWFEKAFKKYKYKGKYFYCYCTKSSHFSFVVKETLGCDVHLETSSSFDLEIYKKIAKKGWIDSEKFVICNGFKLINYKRNIVNLINSGHENIIPIIDNPEEINYYNAHIKKHAYVGVRVATEESPGKSFYTSRLGLNYDDIMGFCYEKIKNNPKLTLKMLHFFVSSGIRDTSYYWNELNKAVRLYCLLKKICPTLDSLNIGGGLPIKTSLAFSFDYEYVIDHIINTIVLTCKKYDVDVPHIFTEFGSFTIGESSANIFSVTSQKQQNDRELWYMIDSSLMTNLPDLMMINQKFMLLAINRWHNQYTAVNVGGITCDSQDYYDSEVHSNQIFLPKVKSKEKLYIGFFNTGAYQESLGGYGGIQHCLLPRPKHILISNDENGKLITKVFSREQHFSKPLKILGY